MKYFILERDYNVKEFYVSDSIEQVYEYVTRDFEVGFINRQDSFIEFQLVSSGYHDLCVLKEIEFVPIKSTEYDEEFKYWMEFDFANLEPDQKRLDKFYEMCHKYNKLEDMEEITHIYSAGVLNRYQW